MNKIYQTIIFFITLLASTSSHAATILLSEDVDDFTDEVEYTLMITDDTGAGAFGAMCTSESYIFLIMPDGMWESDDYANTQFRFDKNEPFTERLMVNSYKSVVSFDKLLMSKVFKNVFEAESFIIKVGTEDTQRFTGLQKGDLAQLNRFLEISSEVDACS